MARILSDKELDNHRPIFGRQLFEVITSGMYDNALMIFREYIQNAADAIDVACQAGVLRFEDNIVRIEIDGANRRITVEDNGSGISNELAERHLKSLGASSKEGTRHRGFRGIGRLGGLAYCDELIFETRSKADEKVFEIKWDRRAFEKLSTNGSRSYSLEETVNAVSTITLREPNANDRACFFRVSLKGVQKFHRDILMNYKAVYNYLSNVAPVAYDHDKFTYADKVSQYLQALPNYRVYNIFLNGKPVYREYQDKLPISQSSSDTIKGIEFFSFSDQAGDPLALGWYARTSFLASLPQSITVRGLRVKQGNIEIGDEYLLKDIYTEVRFAGWIIGEIHTIDGKLKPNARRDGFEVSPEYERFLEQAKILGRQLSSQCRRASSERVISTRIRSSLDNIKSQISSPLIFIDEEHRKLTQERTEQILLELEMSIHQFPERKRYATELITLKRLYKDSMHRQRTLEFAIDGRKLKGYSQKAVLKHVIQMIIKHYHNTASAEELILAILNQFEKK